MVESRRKIVFVTVISTSRYYASTLPYKSAPDSVLFQVEPFVGMG
jgi:hypothetical protein